MKTNLIFLILLFTMLLSRAQNSNYNEIIKSCLLYTDNSISPSEGLELKDTNCILDLKVFYRHDSITNTILFDNSGRITYFKTRLEQVYTDFKSDSITVKSVSYSNQGAYCEDTLIQTFSLDTAGQILSSKTCNGLFNKYKYKKLPFGVVVDVISNDKEVLQHQFIYGKEMKYFQWQIASDRDVIFKFKRSNVGTETNLDSYPHAFHVLLENIQKSDTDEYVIMDALGVKVGKVLIYHHKTKD